MIRKTICHFRTFSSVLQQKLTQNLLNDGEIDKLQYNNILEAARAFHKESLRYVIKKINMTDIWSHAVWVDFFSRETAKQTNIEYFILRFEGILQFDNQEFVDHKTLIINKLPGGALTDADIQKK